MTSKEALSYLDDIAHGRKMDLDPHELYCIVKKDLLVLEILKKSIYNKEIHKRVFRDPLSEPFMILNIRINGEWDINDVKDWLENK